MKGEHLLLWWSRTQQLIALFSAEAELNASIKAGIESLDVANMGRELDSEHSIEVLCDASANIGINLKVDAKKIKHLGVRQLWLQEKVRTGPIAVRKVAGEVNPADLSTKHLPSKDKIHQLTALFGCEYREGRAETAPLLRPNVAPGKQGGHLSGDDRFEPLPKFVMADATPHDPSVLPPMYSDEMINKLFPQIVAPTQIPNGQDWIPGDCFREQEVGDTGDKPQRSKPAAQPEQRRGVRRE